MRNLTLLLWGLALFISLSANAQSITVTGKVKDDKGAAIEGATVAPKGSNNGAVTDAQGSFTIKVKEGTPLVVSAIGFTPVTVAAKAELQINLKPGSKELTEVVITSFGIKREKKGLGYAVSTVGKEQLESRTEGDLARVLNGKAPGLNILNSSGLSGSGTNIVVRAVSTITGSSQPLFIVDGVPFNTNTNASSDFTQGNQTSSRFLDIDPNNIASVSVLKGLSATTLYGEDGRNGVILITTKNGSSALTKRKTEITLTQSVFGTDPYLPEYQTAYGGGFDQSQSVLFYSNWGAKITDPPAQVAHPYDRAALTDPGGPFPEFKGALYDYKFYPSVENFFNKGSVSNTSVNVGGSNGTVSYNASYSYLDDKGFTPGNRFIRNTFGTGGTAKLTNNFILTATFNYAQTNVKSPPTATSFGSGSGSGVAVFGDVMYTPVTIDLMGLPYQNPLDGSTVYYRRNNGIQNPRWTVANAFTEDNVNRIFGNMQLKYIFTPKLSLLYRVGYDNYAEEQLYAQNKGGVNIFEQGIYRTSTGINTIWDHSAIGSFNTDLSEDWNLNIDAGANSKETIYEQTGMKSEQQLVFGILDHSNFISHDSKNEGGYDLDYTTHTLSLGLFTQAQLSFKDYLYINLGARNSWTSTLEPANRSIFYPSGSIAFIPTSAIQSLAGNSTVNYLKVRAGYSTSAEFPGPYSTRASLSIGTRTTLDDQGTAINTLSIDNTLPNPDLKPALLGEFETGVEGTFFNKRVTMDLTLYKRTSKDQILYKSLDPASGYTSQAVNAGNVTNKGIELQLTYNIIKNKNWNWSVTGLYNINKSEVSDIPEGLGSVLIAGYTNLGNFAINGQPLGVIQSNYTMRYYKKDDQGNIVSDPANGQLMVDALGDYVSSPDIGIIADPNPKYKMTGITSVSYKSVSLNAQVEFVKGGDMYANTPSVLVGRGVTRDTEFDRDVFWVLPGVKADGTPNDIQTSTSAAYFDNSAAGNTTNAELAVFDATTVRLRELSLSYQLPQSLLSKTPFGGITFSLTGQNLWFYTPNFPKYVNFDPEANGLGVSNGRGLEFFSGPSARRYGATLRITF